MTLVAILYSTAIVSTPDSAYAQAPDIRNIRPVVMLLLDTSGSMERLPQCVCSTAGCTECLPDCTASDHNRWSIVTEALTGEFTTFMCNESPRFGGIYTNEYDEGYFIPHYELPHKLGFPAQSTNGIIDLYNERVKFGLMTFDSTGTLIDQPPLVTATAYGAFSGADDPNGLKGMYSYADDETFRFPTATVDYMINNGARSESATEGALISVGVDGSFAANADVQSEILGATLRPFGATPHAGMIDDLAFYLSDEEDVREKTMVLTGDSYYNCRSRSAILITDGVPNADMRGAPVNCEAVSDCPYEETDAAIAALIASGALDKLYVVAFDLDDPGTEDDDVEAELADLATVGGTEIKLVTDRTSLYTALNEILDELNPGATSRTAPALSGLSPGLPQVQFFSGFNPSFSAGDPWDGILERRRFTCDINNEPVLEDVDDSDKFQEILTNQSTKPGDVSVWSSNVSVSSFGAAYKRNLWTIVPSDPADVDGHLAGNGEAKLTGAGLPVPPGGLSGLPTVIRNVEPAAFTNSIARTYFNVATDSERDDIVNYVHGQAGTDREDQKLGPIYHSTPVIVGPLFSDIADASFNRFRNGFAHQKSPDSSEVLSSGDWPLTARPRMIYAASTDGIIHAFLADDYPVGGLPSAFACADGETAGTELWGFIPPMVLEDLKDLPAGGVQYLTDGNIMVKNIFDVRTFGAVADGQIGTTNVWRTVLFLSFRKGEEGMVALDITNPCKPEFLWQFANDSDLGLTYGQPAAAQVLLDDGGVDYVRQERGIIILPGGEGLEEGGTCANSGDAQPADVEYASPSTTITARTNRRCWCTASAATGSCTGSQRSGRALYFIDMITGTVIAKLGDSAFPAPLTGGVAVYRGDTGNIGSAAYLTDDDGILWRVDFSDTDPSNWDALALYDLYQGEAADAAERSSNPPIITTKNTGDVVILHGTGNIDVLDDAAAKNKLVSFTEKLTFNVSTGAVSAVSGEVNWDQASIGFVDGEQVTGPLELFNGTLFFGTFQAGSPSTFNDCPLLGSKIYGVSFLEDPATARTPLGKLPGGDMFFDSSDIPDLATTLVMGVQVAQQPTCFTESSLSLTDPFLGSRSVTAPSQTSGRKFKLVAHLSGGSLTSGEASLDVLDLELSNLESVSTINEFVEAAE